MNSQYFKTRNLYKKVIQEVWIKPSILLSELMDRESLAISNNDKDVEWYFCHQQKYITQNTTLTSKVIKTCIEDLISKKLIDTKKGEKNWLWYKINYTNYTKIFYPSSIETFTKEEIHEDLTKDWYIMMHVNLAHNIWILESIFLSELISKRNWYSKKWYLINFSDINLNDSILDSIYKLEDEEIISSKIFFCTNDDMTESTWLSKKQQIRIIKELVNLWLISTCMVSNRYRYFVIHSDNIEKVKNKPYEALLQTESPKGNGSESPKGNGSEFPKGNGWISQKERLNLPKVTVESPKGNANNNYNKNNNNNYKQQLHLLLSKFFKNEDVIDKLINEYSEERINEVYNHVNNNINIHDKAWFIITALRDNYDVKSNPLNELKLKEEKLKQEKIENNLKEKEILNKDLIEKNLIDSWINDENNKEEYLKILKQEELKLIEKGSIVKDYRIKIEARKIIKSEILKLK